MKREIKKTVMVAGYGSAGQYVVDFLLKDHRVNNIEKIVIMSRKSCAQVSPRLEISRISAGLSERYIPLEYVTCDFNDVPGMVKVLLDVRPDIIVYTGRYASGLKYGAFSYPNEIGYGVWIPMSLPYIYNLMKAVKITRLDTKVINTSFPDGVNPLLSSVGLTPYCGAGNLNHLVPRIKRAFKDQYREELLTVDLVGSHYLNTYVSKEGIVKGCPYYLSVKALDENGDEVELINSEEDALATFARCKDDSAGGHIRNQMIATDCAEIVRLLTEETILPSEGTIHVPGFRGLPGGCRVSRNIIGDPEFEIDTAKDIIEITKINNKGLELDGVKIYPGVVRFTDEVRDKMKSVFGLDYPETLEIGQAQEFADKVRERLMSL